MEEYMLKQKIQAAYSEPRAPERLVDAVILRAQAVTMGVQAKQQMATARGEDMGKLAARVLIGRLAEVSELPAGTKPEELAEQLEQEPAFRAALQGGNVARRLENGDLLRQITEPAPAAKPDEPELAVPQKEGPAL